MSPDDVSLALSFVSVPTELVRGRPTLCGPMPARLRVQRSRWCHPTLAFALRVWKRQTGRQRQHRPRLRLNHKAKRDTRVGSMAAACFKRSA